MLAVLAGIGAGVEQRLTRSDLVVPGTKSAQARELAVRHFGESSSLVVLLEGPRGAVDAQGRKLAARLERDRRLAVVGPWARGSVPELRPSDKRALVLIRAAGPYREISEEVVPEVRRAVDHLRAPVKGYVTGYPDVGSGVHKESVRALTQAELIAAPLLLIVLLLVFRSAVAAALPLALGLATIAASRGVIDLVNRFHEVDVVALNMASMMGLALGVDYSLVLVSRFREELAAGAEPGEAARVAASTAGRTVLFAGLALGAAMSAALVVSPGNLMVSSGVGVLAAALLSVAAATTALPAALVLIGRRVNAWSFGHPEGGDGGRWGGVALRAIRRPAVAAALVLGLLLALTAPALALSLGAPDPRNLPESSRERQDFEHVMNSLGAGWSAPYEIVVASRDGRRITDPERLRKLDRWQARLARERGVEAVMGPAPIARGARRIDQFERGLRDARSQFTRATKDQARLQHGLGRVDDGVAQMRGGLALASDGAARLESGAGTGAEGARRLGEGLAMADAGAARLVSGLSEARGGATRLAVGSRQLAAGAGELRSGLRRARRESNAALPRIRELRDGLREGQSGLSRLREPAQKADSSLTNALEALEAMAPTSKADPSYARAYTEVATAKGAVSGVNPVTQQKVDPDYDGLDAELAAASDGLGRAATGVEELERGSTKLVAGLGRLESGAGRLERGVDRLHSGALELRSGLRRLERGGGDLRSGLARLTAGGQDLAAGAGRLSSGAGSLSRGLADGAERSRALSTGVGRMEQGVAAGRSRTDRLGRRLGGGQVDTALFDSGYLPLAALDRAPHEQRVGSTFTVNLDRGGDATRIAVIQGDGNPSEPGTPLRDRLERYADDIGRDTGTVAAVGGAAPTLQDFASEAKSRLPLLALALVIVTYLALVPTLRSLLLPLLAVLLNVLTVAAAFGVLALGFTGSAPLGGAGDLDAIMVLAIFGIVFGLSIDYEVFLLARMREGYDRTGTTEGAVEYGLRKTAGVITGAALIMTGVFVAFALADIASMRQLGVGLTTAVILDATVVRLVLLPALIKLCGQASWWLPAWLDRLLPQLDVEGAQTEPQVDTNGRGTLPLELRDEIERARRERGPVR